MITNSDESGFRVVEYGRDRKITIPNSLKCEIKTIGLRELRRRGIGQHTIEKALHAKVRANTYRKIVAAIKEYNEENESGTPKVAQSFTERTG